MNVYTSTAAAGSRTDTDAAAMNGSYVLSEARIEDYLYLRECVREICEMSQLAECRVP